MNRQIAFLEIHQFKREWAILPEIDDLSPGDHVVVRDLEGEELGRIRYIDTGDDVKNIVLRKATADDIKLHEQLKQEAKEGFAIFCQMLDEFKLKIKPIDAHFRFDRSKICFYIYSEIHQDFRIFHRTIASALHRRVAIKNVGVREYTKFLGGLGPCGNELCCRIFLCEMRPVHLRMARQQNLFVEPNKISGYCGKLCCCLRFEEELYTEALTAFPRIGSTVETKQGKAKVLGIDIFNRKVLVRIKSEEELYLALDDIGEWQ